MLGKKQLAGSASATQFDAYEDWSHHHGMNAVYCKSVDRVQVRQRLAVLCGERHIPSHLSDRST
jgi:hypothetical protein